MDAARNAMHAAAQPSAGGSVSSGGSPRQAEPPPLEHALGRLWDDLQGLLHDQLLLGAWGAAMAAVLIWLLDTGLSLALALAVVVGGTLVLAAGLFWLARQSVGELTFPATLRRLANAPPLRSPE